MLLRVAHRALVACALLGSTALAAEDALACLPPHTCPPGYLASAAHAPANIPAFYFGPEFNRYMGPVAVSLDYLSLYQTGSDGAATLVPTTSAAGPLAGFLAAPLAPLAPGAQYQLRAQLSCGSGTLGEVRADFVAGAVAPLPTALGTLSASAPVAGDIEVFTRAFGPGSCGQRFGATYSDVRVALDPSIVPWEPLLLYSTRVDDADWSPATHGGLDLAPGTSWLGRGMDRIYVACGPALTGSDPNYSSQVPGVTEGTHSVVIRATLPGYDTVVQTPPLTIELHCLSRETDGGAPVDAAMDSGTGLDASDAMTSDAPADSRTERDSAATGAETAGPRGAGCSAGAPSRSRMPLLPAVLVAACFALRRTRRRRM